MQTASPIVTPAPATRSLTPNQYTLVGRGVRIDYSSTSITGDPLLHYKDATHEVNARGQEIRQEETEIGTLVTITLEPDADAGSLLLTVMIPRAQLQSASGQVSISTQALRTRSRFARLPANAQLQTYTVIPVRGSATFVVS